MMKIAVKLFSVICNIISKGHQQDECSAVLPACTSSGRKAEIPRHIHTTQPSSTELPKGESEVWRRECRQYSPSISNALTQLETADQPSSK